ncbi:hypothetical protein [Agaribacterium sp. ZY112]|uniref:hypothetical protein n=1 Tax=Agaribacterium sp. ZY112 TaxID=3233574 RepID=UPI00352389A9
MRKGLNALAFGAILISGCGGGSNGESLLAAPSPADTVSPIVTPSPTPSTAPSATPSPTPEPTLVPVAPADGALLSYDTGFTVMHVRNADYEGQSVIVAASYEGTVIAMNYDGEVLWSNPLSGYMVRDLWAGDLDNDGIDEILAALSDGSIHALQLVSGDAFWQAPFKVNDVPMNAVTTVRSDNGTYVAAGGFDKNMYYLSATGELLNTIESSTYSTLEPWGNDRFFLGREIGKAHTANFLRPIPQADGTDHLLMLGTQNHMQSAGELFEFDTMALSPLAIYDVPFHRPIGHMNVVDSNKDGRYRVLLGSSELSNQRGIAVNLGDGGSQYHDLKGIGRTGYRVTQAETIPDGNSYLHLFLAGTHIVLLPANFDESNKETIAGNYAYNDMWRDRISGRILLASAQSGGSAIHILNTEHAGWKTAFSELEPPGKIQTMKQNFASARQQLTNFTKPQHERAPDPVYLTAADSNHEVAQRLLNAGHSSPVFMSSERTGVRWNQVEDPSWQSDPLTGIANEAYRNREDTRMDYSLTREQAIESYTGDLNNNDNGGVVYWAGHGNDPYYYAPETHMAIIDNTFAQNKGTVMIWPEMAGHDDDFPYVLDHLIYPVAMHAQTRKGKIVLRSKDVFFASTPYLHDWERLLSGEFKNVFVSSMEETTDKTQDISLAGRLGLWSSGVMDDWGMRCSRDNPSFDRSRQHSYQRILNHFLRTTVYSLAYGASYTQNTYTDADTMSFVWELVASGALYVPRREEIVSFNPVHISITEPDERYITDASSNKVTTYFDAEDQANNPMVFGRMNATWMGAAPTEWDYSSYASGVKERRQEFIPPFEQGMVLLTPVQRGKHKAVSTYRKNITNYLHPLYSSILTEHISNGRDYIDHSSDTTYAANSDYYKEVASDIEAGAKQIPITVSGGVGWVVAQTDPTHLRLTLVDSGYLNPSNMTAKVQFNTVNPVSINDLLSGEEFAIDNDGNVDISIPLGLFRFIDIEIDQTL